MLAIKNKAIILEGDRNYSDGLWDIPIYKTSISSQNYNEPNIHPGIHPSRTPAVCNTLIAEKTNKIWKKRESRLPKEFRYSDNRISDNINYIAIEKQMNKDKTLYRPVTIQSPSMSVIIRKKQTHTELVQYLHATAFSPVKSTFEKAVRKDFFKLGQV